jgi:hypothetical protein
MANDKVLHIAIVEKGGERVYKYRYYYLLAKREAGLDNVEEATLLAAGYKPVEYVQREIVLGIVEKMNGLQNVRIGGKSFPEMLAFENISLWQFIAGHIYMGEMQETIEAIEYAVTLINRLGPSSIYVWGHGGEHHLKAMQLAGKKNGIAVEFDNKPKEQSAKTGLLSRIKRRLSFEISKRRSKPSPNIEEQIEKHHRASIGSYAREQGTATHEGEALLVAFGRFWEKNQDGKDIDQYYEAFKPFFEEQHLKAVRLEIPYYFNIRGSVKQYIDEVKAGKGGFCSTFFDEYLTPEILQAAEEHQASFESIFEQLTRSSSFLEQMEWRGISFFYPLFDYWKSLFTEFLVNEVVVALYTAREIYATLKPKLAFIINEVGVYGRAMIVEGYRAGVKTIGLQHAIFFEETEYYLHKNQQAHPDLSKGFYGFISPQLTLVHSAHFKEILTRKGFYEPSSVAVFYEWRLLNTDFTKLEQRAEKLKHQLFGGQEKKVALLLTSTSSLDIINLMKSKLDATAYNILVKLHPADKEGELYKKVFEDAGFNVAVLTTSLHDCISMSDLVFAPLHTTAVLDALTLEKKVYCYSTFDYGATAPWRNIVFDAMAEDRFDGNLTKDYLHRNELFLEQMGYNKRVKHADLTAKLSELLVAC